MRCLAQVDRRTALLGSTALASAAAAEVQPAQAGLFGLGGGSDEVQIKSDEWELVRNPHLARQAEATYGRSA